MLKKSTTDPGTYYVNGESWQVGAKRGEESIQVTQSLETHHGANKQYQQQQAFQDRAETCWNYIALDSHDCLPAGQLYLMCWE